MRDAYCGTDHKMQRSILNLKIRAPARKRYVTSRNLNTNLLNTETVSLQIQEATSSSLAQQLDNPIQNIDQDWSATAEKLLKIATDFLGYQKKRHRDWFVKKDEKLSSLVEKKELYP